MTRSSNFSPEAARRAIEFIGCLKHTKGSWRGVPFVLPGWQREIVERTFGTVRPSRGARRKLVRQYRKLFLAVAKKNGKTGLASAFGAVGLYADDEFGAEVYSGAASRDQATLVYRELSAMIKQVPTLRKMSRFYDSVKRIYVPSTESFYQALSADADYSDGINPSMWIADELHRHKSRELYDLLNQGSGTREQPLGIVITTAGYDRTSVCWEEWQYAREVAAGKIEDPTFLSRVFEVPDEVDWGKLMEDESLWYLANPALGDFLDIEDLRKAVREANYKPAMQNSVRRLRFNQWTQAEEHWFESGQWEACGGIVDEAKLQGRDCYGGLDLASTSDFAAWVLIFPREDQGFDVLPRLYLPEAAVERRERRRDQLQAWARHGYLTITPGNVVDYDWIKSQIHKDAEAFRIREIGFDPWTATQISVQLAEDGLTLVPVRQGFRTLSSPSKLLETLVAKRLINHGGHPVLSWMAGNATVEVGPTEEIKPSKRRSAEKIDGIVALITALERAMHAEPDSVACVF